MIKRPLAFFGTLTCRIILCLTANSAQAGIENLLSLGDVNPSPIVEISAVGPGASTASAAFFSASDTEHGTELWRDNGMQGPELYSTAPGWEPSVVGGGSVLRYTFIRTATLPQGYALAVECSPDMTPLSWVSIATKTENAAWTGDAMVTETTLPDGRVLVEVDAPISGNCRFFRLQATY